MPEVEVPDPSRGVSVFHHNVRFEATIAGRLGWFLTEGYRCYGLTHPPDVYLAPSTCESRDPDVDEVI